MGEVGFYELEISIFQSTSVNVHLLRIEGRP
jgi:hypothetical protein